MIALIVTGAVLLVTSPAQAQAQGQYTIKNKRFVQFLPVPGVPVTYLPHPHLRSVVYNTPVTASTTYNATIPLTPQFVSAQLGFPVGTIWQLPVSFKVNLPPGRPVTVTPIVVYAHVVFEIWQGNQLVGTGLALHYRYYHFQRH